MGGIALDYRVPAADLRPYVTLFYHFRCDAPRFDDVERADYAQLRFRLTEGDGTYVFHDGHEYAAPACHLLGATTGAKRAASHAPVEIIGVGLYPPGLVALVAGRGGTVRSLTDRGADAVAMFGAAAADARQAMVAAEGTDAKIAIAEAFVRTMLVRADAGAVDFARQIEAWLLHAVNPDMVALAAAIGLSRRQIERRCNALYGAPPRALARKYRALRAAVALASGTATLDDLLRDGFYDQSHLIRELRHFTGMTPRQICEGTTALARLTIERRRALGGEIDALLRDT